jgi:hypothetical protein
MFRYPTVKELIVVALILIAYIMLAPKKSGLCAMTSYKPQYFPGYLNEQRLYDSIHRPRLSDSSDPYADA